MRDIYEPPISTASFQAELDRLVRSYPGHEKLRIEWAPRLVEARVIDKDGHERVYKKYPVLGAQTSVYHVGNYFRRRIGGKERTIGYQKMGGLIPPNVRPADLAVAHLERVNHSVHYFVIEKRLPSDYAQEEWAKKCQMSREKLGINIFGAFPKEGVWVWFDDISEHRFLDGSQTCCDVADTAHIRCRGLYREPDNRDLANVHAALQQWQDRKNLSDKTALIEQEARDYTAAVNQWEASELLTILQEAREESSLDKIAQERTRIDLGSNPPIHRTAY